jgi:hypothetical protein
MPFGLAFVLTCSSHFTCLGTYLSGDSVAFVRGFRGLKFWVFAGFWDRGLVLCGYVSACLLNSMPLCMFSVHGVFGFVGFVDQGM